MATVCPDSAEDYVRIKEHPRQRIENPNDFLFFRIHFAAGSKRILHSMQQPLLTSGWDKEAGVLRGWYLAPAGEVHSEEYGKR